MSKKNKRKSSLKSTILLLLLAAILLIVSTYAWFTSNKTVTISTIDVNVAAVNGLQISTDATNWKSVITKAEIIKGYTGAVNQIPNVLRPCSTDKKTNADGNMNMYYGEVTADEKTGEYSLATSLQTDKSESGADATGYYVAFDFFLRIDQDTDIYLTTKSGVSANGDDLGLKNASRIAFVNEGNVATGSSSTTAQALKKAESVILWEPNNNDHTDAAIANANDTYSKSISSDTVIASYYGVNSGFTGVALNDTDATHFTEITPDIATGTAMEYKKFVTLKKGITKFRAYMWVEGQDVDCENNASGTDINFDVQFSINSSDQG